ncbi:hypothetical protein [Nocardia sp. NBC_00416]|uniref:hypothetical protein n=1 Tax=Nocardia sp. NBC_00416 TaxID=2975991 RepID=UPI002E22F23C
MSELTALDHPVLGLVASFALPVVGGFFKNPLYGALGGLAGGALHGFLNKHSGWDLVADVAIGAAGGGLGASFGRKSSEALLMEGKAGRTVGEVLSNFTRSDRALRTGTSMSMAGAGTALPILGKDIAKTYVAPYQDPFTGSLPTVSIGRGDR